MATTYTEAATSIVTLVHTDLLANQPSLKVFWDNTQSIDLDQVGDLFLRIHIDFDDAKQMTVTGTPEHRTYGEAIFTVFVKENSGGRRHLALFDHLADLVKFKNTSKVQFGVPTPGRKDGPRTGWVSYDLVVGFYFDSLDWAM